MRKTALITLSLLLAMPAVAQDAEPVPVYDVELVVFRHVRPLLSSEQWSAQTLAANVDAALDFSQPEAFPDLLEAVTQGEPQHLIEHVARLTARAAFEVLLHKAWRQPGFESDAALAIRINASPLDEPVVARPADSQSLAFATPGGVVQGDQPIGNPPPFALRQPGVQPAAQGELQPIELQAPALALATADDDPGIASPLITHVLDGTLTVVRSRFLHVYTDLVYTIPADALPQAIRRRPLLKPGQPTEETMEVGSGIVAPASERLSMQSFPLRYHRRMRSNEMHYIDHPLLGILILVTRVEVDPSELTE